MTKAIALFLGAGFSKEWGLPLTDKLLPVTDEEWTQIIEKKFPRRQKQFATKVRASWLKYRNECPGRVDQFAEKLQRDEQGAMGLSFNDLAKFIAMRLAVDQSVVREFNRQRQHTKNHIRMQRKIPSCYDELMKVLEEYSLKGILTTNYDLVVEKILGPTTTGRLGGFHYGKQGQPVLGIHHASTRDWYHLENITGTIPLLKLHGSLNWDLLEDKGCINVYVDCRPSLKRGFHPAIVPPHSDIPQYDVLSQTWQKAPEILKDADVWVFCGYSFSDYDIDNVIGELLQSSTYNLRRVIILSPEATKYAEKVRNILKAPVLKLEVKCGPGLGPDFTSSKLRFLISGDDSE